MSFDRLKAQLFCEALVDSASHHDWATRRSAFEGYTLTASDATFLQRALLDDCSHLVFKGVLSLVEAVSSMRVNLFSWSVVRLYYSCFYFLRASLAARGFAVVRNKSLYLLRATVNQQPKKCLGNKFRNDHVGVINIFKDVFGTSDKLQSNQIDMENPYEWLMEARNQVNYRERQFHDPGCPVFCQVASERAQNGQLDSLLDSYVTDKDFIYCFQADHAWLALPIKRAALTLDDAETASVSLVLPSDKADLLNRIVGEAGRASAWGAALLSKFAR